jgi:signal transduction histidine kinase
MNFLKENFGFEKVSLSDNEQTLLGEQIKKVDENRLELFAIVSSFAVLIMLILDLFFFDLSLRTFYLLFDSAFFLNSVFVLIFSALSRKKESQTIQKLKKTGFDLYPILSLLWATAICALDTKSMLNLLTFYFVLCLISFAVLTPIKTLLIYFLLIVTEFILLCVLKDKPVIAEPFFTVLIGCLLVLPFYSSFRSIRVNAQSALIKLNTMNKSLKNEVEISIRELQHLNNNLNIEVSQRKIIESKLRESLKMVESSNQLKSEFLANISHEIRTPLNSIVGFSEMITEDGVPPERKKEYQELIASNTMYLLSTIDDIFDASILKTDQINPVMKPFIVNSFLDTIYYETNGIELKYQKKNIRFIRKNVENQNLMVNTDEFYLKKAMTRLIDNAFKFTEKGSIETGASVVNGSLEFFVKDTGIGIAEKDQIRIFEPFVQGDGSFTRGYGGSGLGLTIVKGIIRALGAEFDFQSTQGAGSRFTIRFNKYFLQ